MGIDAGLPGALVGGAALAALATAVGAGARIQTFDQRAILWIPLLAPAGAGKSPAQELAFRTLRERDAGISEDEQQENIVRIRFPAAEQLLLGDVTMEALARELPVLDGAVCLDLDELALFLRGLGEYKRAASGDRGRFLQLWTGSPWRYVRVAAGKDTNKLRIHIPKPTVVICGGLQPHYQELLGSPEDGMSARWLPHLAAMPEGDAPVDDVVPPGWGDLLDRVLARRQQKRVWGLTEEAHQAFMDHRQRWKHDSRGDESQSVRAALTKADVHLARIALVLAEAECLGPSGLVDADLIERAAALMDFSLDCWRALPASGSLGLTARDRALDDGVQKLLGWLETRDGGQASKREIQRACVAGARTPGDVDALISRYEQTYPGTVVTVRGGRGPASVVVRAPRRQR